VCKFGGDLAICLREVIGQHEIATLATLATLYTLQHDRLTDKLITILRAATIAGGRSKKVISSLKVSHKCTYMTRPSQGTETANIA